MAITQGMCTSFKQQLFLAQQDMDTDVFKIALYTSAASLDFSTTVYTTADEVSSSGTNYTAGGNILTGVTVNASGSAAYVDFADTVWPAATITARGALIYNSSKANAAVAVIDFGSDRTSTAGNFTIQFPPNNSTNAILRIA